MWQGTPTKTIYESTNSSNCFCHWEENMLRTVNLTEVKCIFSYSPVRICVDFTSFTTSFHVFCWEDSAFAMGGVLCYSDHINLCGSSYAYLCDKPG